MTQLVAHLDSTLATAIPSVRTVIVGGDFNTNPDEGGLVDEQTLNTLERAGFTNCWAGVPLEARITHPHNGRYPGATFDYLFLRGGKLIGSPTITPTRASDHQPVTVDLKATPASPVR